MKRFLTIVLLALLPVAKAQTLELSVTYPFSAQLALTNVAISDALTLGFAVSTERLKVSSSAALDIAPFGSAQASLGVEWAYVGRVRVLLATRATLGSATLNLSGAFWNAAPLNFDALEIFAPDPLPNSTSGSRIDFGMGLRVSRSLSLFAQFKFGSSSSSQALQLRQRSRDSEFFVGVFSGSQLNSTIYLLQAGYAFTTEEENFSLGMTGGLGIYDNSFAPEMGFELMWLLSESFELGLRSDLQFWRSDVLPFRNSLELKFLPGLGTLNFGAYLGLTPQSAWNWGLRLSYRIGFEEIFPT
jgi:hypothetical protein